MPERTPLGARCRYCGSDQTFIERRFEPAQIGSFSLAGAQLKLSAKTWPYAVCDGCGHVSRGEYVAADETNRTVGASGGDAGAIGIGTCSMRERQDTLADGDGMEDPSTPPRSTSRHHALMSDPWWCPVHDAGCEGCHCPRPAVGADRTNRSEETR